MPASQFLASPRRLLPAVVRQFLPGMRRSTGMNPLVLVDPTVTAATTLLRDLHGCWASRDPGAAAWLPSRELGRELAAAAEAGVPHLLEKRLSAQPSQDVEQPGEGLAVLVVPEVDQLGPAAAQRPFVRLLETAIRSGVLCCVSVASLTAGPLEVRLSSRLAEGLVLPLSQPVARPVTAALESALRKTPRQTPSVRRVIAAAARQHGLEPEDLIGPSRRRGVTGARAIAMFVLRAVSGRSLHAIGQSFGGRDHTTVLHAVRLVGERIASDPATARDVERLLASVAPPRGGQRCRLDVG